MDVQVSHCICNDIFNHTSLCEFHQGKLLLHLTIPFEEKPKTNLPSDNLRYYRQRKQMTTRQLAEKLNIVPATIVMYENGKHPIPYAVSIKLADVLEIEASLLYDDFSRFLAVPYTEALKSVRTALGLSQKAFAEQIGIVPSYYYSTQSTPRVMIPPLASHTRKVPERRAYKPQFRQKRKRSRSPAGPRRLRDSDAHKRIAVPKALCVL